MRRPVPAAASSCADLHERNIRNVARRELRQVDPQLDRCRSAPARRTRSPPSPRARCRMRSAGKVTMPVSASTLKPVTAVARPPPRARSRHRLGDGPHIIADAGAIALHQLERGPCPVARADHLVEGRDLRARRAGLEVEMVLPAEPVQPPAPLLEEGDHRMDVVERLDAVARVVAPPRLRPAAVALLARPSPSRTISVRRSGPPELPREIAAGKRTSSKAHVRDSSGRAPLPGR